VIIWNQVKLLLLPIHQLDYYGLFKSERNVCLYYIYTEKEGTKIK
jgi:hypothetical protein